MKKGLVIGLGCMICVLMLTGCGKSKDILAAEEAITAIGEVTIDSGDAIAEAEKLYDLLSDSEKAGVNNYLYLDLVEAREAFEILQNEQIVADYLYDLETATYTMLSGAADAEKAGNLILDVWYNAIYEMKDETTDMYTRPNGYFYEDFNDALGELFSDSDFESMISDIRDNQNDVIGMMKGLKNPPKECGEAYDALKAYYDEYLKFTNIVIRCNGSYNSFSENFSNADNNTLDAFYAMKLYIE